MKIVSRATDGYEDLMVVVDLTPRMLELIEMGRHVFRSEFIKTPEFNACRFQFADCKLYECVMDGVEGWEIIHEDDEKDLGEGFDPVWGTMNVGAKSIHFEFWIGDDVALDTFPLSFEELSLIRGCK